MYKKLQHTLSYLLLIAAVCLPGCTKEEEELVGIADPSVTVTGMSTTTVTLNVTASPKDGRIWMPTKISLMSQSVASVVQKNIDDYYNSPWEMSADGSYSREVKITGLKAGTSYTTEIEGQWRLVDEANISEPQYFENITGTTSLKISDLEFTTPATPTDNGTVNGEPFSSDVSVTTEITDITYTSAKVCMVLHVPSDVLSYQFTGQILLNDGISDKSKAQEFYLSWEKDYNPSADITEYINLENLAAGTQYHYVISGEISFKRGSDSYNAVTETAHMRFDTPENVFTTLMPDISDLTVTSEIGSVDTNEVEIYLNISEGYRFASGYGNVFASLNSDMSESRSASVYFYLGGSNSLSISGLTSATPYWFTITAPVEKYIGYDGYGYVNIGNINITPQPNTFTTASY